MVEEDFVPMLWFLSAVEKNQYLQEALSGFDNVHAKEEIRAVPLLEFITRVCACWCVGGFKILYGTLMVLHTCPQLETLLLS